MRIKQEELPTAMQFMQQVWEETDGKDQMYINEKDEFWVENVMKRFLKLHKDKIKYEYDQYQFFLEGYKNGSASISEVTNAHNEFLKLLE